MKLRTLTALLLLAGVAAHAAQAQTPASDADEKKKDAKPEQRLERVEVTGSSLKRISVETASPVQIISKEIIESMGARTLMQVLDNLPAARPAQQDFRSMFTGTDGASQANLRGLGAHGTLVLLNGRRLSYYGAPAGFMKQFVNIDAIPAAAIERMEVLTDGASAVYGSDAIAGVINIITKKSFTGLELRASTDRSQEVGAYGEHQAALLYGFGDYDRDGFNVYASVNAYKRDRVKLEDTYDKRPAHFYVNNPAYITNFRLGSGSKPGELNRGTLFVFDAAAGNARTQRAVNGCTTTVTEASGTRCVWETLHYALDTVPSSERINLFVNGRLNLGGGWEGFAQASYSDIDMQGENGPRAFNSGTTITWYSRNTGTQLNRFVYPFLSPNHPYVKANLAPDMVAKMGGAAGLQYLMQDIATEHFGQRNTDKNYRVVAGLRGTLFDGWDFEGALALAGSDSTLFQTVNINTEGFAKAFGPITVDPVSGRSVIADNAAYKFGEISAANAQLLREAFPTFDIKSWTRLSSLDAKLEGTLMQLPAGELRTAFGLSLMRESFDTPGNKDAADGRITQQGGSWFDGGRTVAAVFGEALVPISKTLEANVAARIDKYPNFDANLAPKLGLKWRTMPQLLLRSTYSEGFRAPSLAESGEGGVFAQIGGQRDPVRCDEMNAIANLLLKSATATDVTLGRSLLNSNCSLTVGGRTPPNPDLKPEKAKIATFGVVLEPARDVSVSLDYWFVQRRNEIIRQDTGERLQQLIEQFGPGLQGTDLALRNPITDTDQAHMAAVAAMCADPANAAACPATLPRFSVGTLAGLVTQYINRGRTLLDGFDIDARSRHRLGDWGSLNLGASLTIRNRETYNSDTGWGYGENYVGSYGSPKYRGTLSAAWNLGQFTTSLFMNWTGSTSWRYGEWDTTNTPENCKAASVSLPADLCSGTPSWATFNLGLNWRPSKQLALGLNIKNITNKMPYYDPNGWEGYNHSLNLYGRQFALSAVYKFN
ncbi:MAG: TonB-dependent receptor plug domain-containing protein [Inhella sp.]